MPDDAGEAAPASARRRPGPSAILCATAALFIAAGGTAPLVPPGCGIGWTMIGHTLIYVPDCTHPSSPAPPPDGAPPPDPGPPPQS